MAKGYRPVDRDQQFLMPPDMREWLSVDDPVWLVIETVAGLDTSGLHALRKTGGVGRAGYHPDMLLTLLIWGWAHGQRSSRRLEQLCRRDVAYRIICAGDAPDHVTISRFRAQAADVVADLFTQVLMVCARVGMGEVGVVALDGVKIASNASISASRSEDGLRKALAAEAARAAREHAETDAGEEEKFGDGRGDQLPAELADPQSRRARIAAALAEVEEHTRQVTAEDEAVAARRDKRKQAAEIARTDRAELLDRVRRTRGSGNATGKGTIPTEIRVEILTQSWERAVAAQQAKVDRWRPGQSGPRPSPVHEGYYVVDARRRLDRAIAERDQREAAAAAAAATTIPASADSTAIAKGHRRSSDPRGNITDPQSRMMPLRGGGWLQGFNCQAVTTADGLIIATSVGNNHVDAPTYIDMVDQAVAAATVIDDHRPTPTGGQIGVVLADAGYLSNANLAAAGPDRLIATGKSRALARAARQNPTSGEPPAGATPIHAMAHRLATPEGHALYSQRGHIAETPFGHAKHNLGFRRFSSRGIRRAQAEFAFHALVHNLFKAIGTGHLTPATI